VGEAFQVAAFHHASAALDGVGSAEDGVDVAGFFRVGFQCQQAGFHFRQSLEAFLEEHLLKLSQLHDHGHLLPRIGVSA
jgi:hypothetical protein